MSYEGPAAGFGAQLPAEVGALLLKALSAALPEVPESETAEFESRDVSAETSVLRVPIACCTDTREPAARHPRLIPDYEEVCRSGRSTRRS